MTREEAIEVLEKMKYPQKVNKNGFVISNVNIENEALDMAIKALSQESCEDIAQERYKDLCEYFGGAKDILKSREDFKAWLERVKWHIRKAEELYEKYEYKKEPCDDVISRKAVLKLKHHKPEYGDMIYAFDVEQLPSVTQKSGKWIALVARPMTNEEREYYSEKLDYCDGDAAIYDCPLPEEGQDVLITTCTGGVLIDTFFNDYDGCGFEGYDIEDVKAWMPLPKPYEPQESEDKE